MLKDIYIIKNDINNKVYIGQSINPKTRFQHHCKPHTNKTDISLISQAINKYGREHFWFEILESQVEDYNEKEIYWIQKYNSLVPNGYNLTEGGEDPPNYKGADSPSSTLSSEQVEALTKELKETDETMESLSQKYGFKSITSVSEFNKGETYYRDFIDYPIRKDVKIGKLTKKDVEEIIHLLKFSYQSFEDIGSKYKVEGRAISRINKGMFHKVEGEEYPIRNWKATSNPPKLTYEEVTEIIHLIQNTSLSLREIAKQYKVEYYDILGIKNGTTKIYRRQGLVYPLRSNN